MPLAEADLLVIRSWVGATPTDDAIEDKYDRLGTIDGVIIEVLVEKEQALIDQPSSISSPDGSSISFTSNLQAIRTKIRDFQKLGGTAGSADEAPQSNLVRFYRRDYR